MKKKDRKKKVMFICSVGGHLTQMLQVKDLFDEYDYVLVTDKTEVTKEMNKKYNMEYMIYCSGQYKLSYPFLEVCNVFRAIWYLIKHNPEVVVSTGAHTAGPTCYIAKFLRKKVIFIESFAKRTSPTKTGKAVYRIADKFIVQWESLKEFYPDAEVWGWIY